MKRLGAALLGLALWTSCALGATLLPNGKQQFISNTGAPLAGGSVAFYVPGTTVARDTWQDAGQSILNTNPVILDSLGSALIYGTGAYRQIVRDLNGNIIWDQITTDVSAASSQGNWVGTSTGTANAQVVVAPNFSSTDGQQLVFRAGFTNTGAMTLNPNSAGPITVNKDTTSGPLPLSSGDISAGNVITVTYVAADGSFHTAASNSAALPTGMMVDFAGSTAPSGWLLCYGQAISRTTFSTLFAIIGTQYGVGDGSTTFNLPDTRGRVMAGLDNLGGSAAGVLNTTYYVGGTPTTLGSRGGSQSHTITTAEIPVMTPTVSSISLTVQDLYATANVSAASNAAPLSASAVTSLNNPTTPNSAITGTITINPIGSGGTMTVVQPTMVVSKIIKF